MKKVVLVGAEKSGKSALLQRKSKGTFSEEYTPTSGISFAVKTVKSVELQIWDKQQTQKYKIITSTYYKDVEVVLLLFDLNSRESFAQVPSLLKEINEYSIDVSVLLVGTKSDLEQVITDSEIAKIWKGEFFKISSKTGANTEALFSRVADLVKERSSSRKAQLF